MLFTRPLRLVVAAVLISTNVLTPSAWAALAAVQPPPPKLDLAHLDLKGFTVPSEWGHVTDVWQPDGHPPKGLVIHLQDLHTQPEAQQHLNELIGYLHERYGIDLVALEGAQGLCDTTLYSDFPDPPSTEKISRLFMQEGLFTGAEYYGITHPGTVTLWGVEDEALYLEHLKTYQQGAAQQADADAVLNGLQQTLTPLRQRLYPASLQRLLTLRDAYDQGTDRAFTPYMEELRRLATSAKLDLSRYPHLEAMAQAQELYAQLDARRVEDDQKRLVAVLRPQLTRAEEEFLARVLRDAKSHRLPTDYYAETLAQIARAHGVSLDPPPRQPATALDTIRRLGTALAGAAPQSSDEYHALRRYVSYLKLSKDIRSSELIPELDALAEAVEAALLTTDQQRTLARLLKQCALLDELLHAKLSPSSLRDYQRFRPDLTADALWHSLARVTSPFVTKTQLEQLVSTLPAHEHFYDLALKRDDALLRNTLTLLDSRSTHHEPRAAILITGGFHTPGLTEQLKAHRIAYAVITPTVTGDFDESRYEARLGNQLPSVSDLVKRLDTLALVPSLATNIPLPQAGEASQQPSIGKSDQPQASGPAKKSGEILSRFLALKAHVVRGVAWLTTWIQQHPQLAALYGITLTVVAGKLVLYAAGIEYPLSPDDGVLLGMAVLGSRGGAGEQRRDEGLVLSMRWHLRQLVARTIISQIQNSYYQARALGNLATQQAQAGFFAEARATISQIQDRYYQAAALGNLATQQVQAGQPEAAQTFAEARTTISQISDSYDQARALVNLATQQVVPLLESIRRSGTRLLATSTLQEQRPDFLNHAKARTLLNWGLLLPETADQWYHDLVRLRAAGAITPQQLNQYEARLRTLLQSQGLLPTSYGAIQIIWLGIVEGLGSGLARSPLRPVRLVLDPTPTRYAPMDGVVPAHLEYADRGGADYPAAFQKLWVFDEAHRKPFRVNGRTFIGLGVTMDGARALYLDQATGALCSMCIDLNRTQATYAQDVQRIFQQAYARGGLGAVRELLATLPTEQAVSQLFDQPQVQAWVRTLPAQEQEAMRRPVDALERMFHHGDALAYLQREVERLRQDRPDLAARYFGPADRAALLGVRLTPEGEAWLGQRLGTSDQEALWRLGALKLLRQANFTLNPDPVIRILHAMSMGLGLGYYEVTASHREALRNKITPALEAATFTTEHVDPQVWIRGQALTLEDAQIGAPLLPFLQRHLPEALTHGLYIWGQQVPAALLDEYVVLPGDAYGLTPQFAGTPQEAAHQLEQWWAAQEAAQPLRVPVTVHLGQALQRQLGQPPTQERQAATVGELLRQLGLSEEGDDLLIGIGDEQVRDLTQPLLAGQIVTILRPIAGGSDAKDESPGSAAAGGVELSQPRQTVLDALARYERLFESYPSLGEEPEVSARYAGYTIVSAQQPYPDADAQDTALVRPLRSKTILGAWGCVDCAATLGVGFKGTRPVRGVVIHHLMNPADEAELDQDWIRDRSAGAAHVIHQFLNRLGSADQKVVVYVYREDTADRMRLIVKQLRVLDPEACVLLVKRDEQKDFAATVIATATGLAIQTEVGTGVGLRPSQRVALLWSEVLERFFKGDRRVARVSMRSLVRQRTTPKEKVTVTGPAAPAPTPEAAAGGVEAERREPRQVVAYALTRFEALASRLDEFRQEPPSLKVERARRALALVRRSASGQALAQEELTSHQEDLFSAALNIGEAFAQVIHDDRAWLAQLELMLESAGEPASAAGVLSGREPEPTRRLGAFGREVERRGLEAISLDTWTPRDGQSAPRRVEMPTVTSTAQVLAWYFGDRPLRALDVGTGDGQFVRDLQQRFPGRFGTVIGVDPLAPLEPPTLLRLTLHQAVGLRVFPDPFELVILNSPPRVHLDALLEDLSQIVTDHAMLVLTSNQYTEEEPAGSLTEEAQRLLQQRGWQVTVLPAILPDYPLTISTRDRPGRMLVALHEPDPDRLRRGVSAFEAPGPAAPAPEAGTAEEVPRPPGREAPPEATRCVTGDTRLPIRREVDGRGSKVEEIPITQVQPGDQVLSLNEATGRLEWHRITGLLPQGVKSIVELETEQGQRIRTTANHPYLVVAPLARADREDQQQPFAQQEDDPPVADAQAERRLPIPRQLDDVAIAQGVGHHAEVLQAVQYTGLVVQGQPAELFFSGRVEAVARHAADYLGSLRRVFTRRWTSSAVSQERLRSASALRASRALTTRGLESSMKSTRSSSSALEMTVGGASTPRRAFSSMTVTPDEVAITPKDSRPAALLSNARWVPVAALRVGDALAIATDDHRGVDVTTIKRLTHLPPEAVYDIEVEGTHNFVANDILAHNTSLQPPPTTPGPAAPAPPAKGESEQGGNTKSVGDQAGGQQTTAGRTEQAEPSARAVPGGESADRSTAPTVPLLEERTPPDTAPTSPVPFLNPPLPLEQQRPTDQRNVQGQPDHEGDHPKVLAEDTAHDQTAQHRVAGAEQDLQQGVPLLGGQSPHGVAATSDSTTAGPTWQDHPTDETEAKLAAPAPIPVAVTVHLGAHLRQRLSRPLEFEMQAATLGDVLRQLGLLEQRNALLIAIGEETVTDPARPLVAGAIVTVMTAMAGGSANDSAPGGGTVPVVPEETSTMGPSDGLSRRAWLTGAGALLGALAGIPAGSNRQLDSRVLNNLSSVGDIERTLRSISSASKRVEFFATTVYPRFVQLAQAPAMEAETQELISAVTRIFGPPWGAVLSEQTSLLRVAALQTETGQDAYTRALDRMNRNLLLPHNFFIMLVDFWQGYRKGKPVAEPLLNLRTVNPEKSEIVRVAGQTVNVIITRPHGEALLTSAAAMGRTVIFFDEWWDMVREAIERSKGGAPFEWGDQARRTPVLDRVAQRLSAMPAGQLERALFESVRLHEVLHVALDLKNYQYPLRLDLAKDAKKELAAMSAQWTKAPSKEFADFILVTHYVRHDEASPHYEALHYFLEWARLDQHLATSLSEEQVIDALTQDDVDLRRLAKEFYQQWFGDIDAHLTQVVPTAPVISVAALGGGAGPAGDAAPPSPAAASGGEPLVRGSISELERARSEATALLATLRPHVDALRSAVAGIEVQVAAWQEGRPLDVKEHRSMFHSAARECAQAVRSVGVGPLRTSLGGGDVKAAYLFLKTDPINTLNTLSALLDGLAASTDTATMQERLSGMRVVMAQFEGIIDALSRPQDFAIAQHPTAGPYVVFGEQVPGTEGAPTTPPADNGPTPIAGGSDNNPAPGGGAAPSGGETTRMDQAVRSEDKAQESP